MGSSVLAERAWRLTLLFCALLLFLQFWGPPSWLGVFPESAFFRFLDALACDAAALILCLWSRLFVGRPDPWWRRVTDGLAAVFVAGFCLLVAFSRPLQEFDGYLRGQVAIVTLVLSGQALLKGARPGRFLLAAAPAFLGGWLLESLVPETHGFLLLCGGAGLLLLAALPLREVRSKVPPRKETAKALSEREWEIVCHLREGKTNQEIAQALFISAATVKSHLAHIQEKTGARNRVEILRILLSADGESPFRPMESKAGRAHDVLWRNS